MLGFLVAFRSKGSSKNWEEDCMLLQNTLQSICNQIERKFKVFVIYTDLPEIIYDAEKVFFVKFPFPVLAQEALIETALLVNPLFDLEKNLRIAQDYDKSKRISYACTIAKEHYCDFVMSVDADDLISNRIASFVHANKEEKYGWFVNAGYIRSGSGSFLIKVKRLMVNINGSTNIVHINLIPEANFESRLVAEFAFFHWHSYLRYKIKEQYKDTLKPLPFYAIIYILHDSSLSGYNAFLKKQVLKTAMKYLLRGKWLTKSMKKEFGINGK